MHWVGAGVAGRWRGGEAAGRRNAATVAGQLLERTPSPVRCWAALVITGPDSGRGIDAIMLSMVFNTFAIAVRLPAALEHPAWRRISRQLRCRFLQRGGHGWRACVPWWPARGNKCHSGAR